ncbi:fructose-bisphosphate aldolase [Tolypothrix sp. PCC 7601]|nr:fructose-bisphosphate aldolase [Tolypothrix sp. PCC 7601]
MSKKYFLLFAFNSINLPWWGNTLLKYSENKKRHNPAIQPLMNTHKLDLLLPIRQKLDANAKQKTQVAKLTLCLVSRKEK